MGDHRFNSRMAETTAVVAELPKRKHVRQPPAVPFLWEQRPGMPKKDWKPEFSSDSVRSPSVITPPVKLIAAVPFDWEEKPGTPLPGFSQPAEALSYPQETLLALPPPPAYSQSYYGVDYDNDVGSHDDYDERYRSFDFETDSFSSAPSLLANCLVPSATISSAIPLQTAWSSDELDEIPPSPASETDSSTSSYATGTSSLVGSSFLQCLFPLLPPKTSFLEKTMHSEWESVTQSDVNSKGFDRESNSSVINRRPTTLGELIMMSRRRNYQSKAVQMRKQNLSMEFEKRALGCSVFGSGIKMIEGLQRKKHNLILKFLQE